MKIISWVLNVYWPESWTPTRIFFPKRDGSGEPVIGPVAMRRRVGARFEYRAMTDSEFDVYQEDRTVSGWN